MSKRLRVEILTGEAQIEDESPPITIRILLGGHQAERLGKRRILPQHRIVLISDPARRIQMIQMHVINLHLRQDGEGTHEA